MSLKNLTGDECVDIISVYDNLRYAMRDFVTLNPSRPKSSLERVHYDNCYKRFERCLSILHNLLEGDQEGDQK